MLYLVFFHSLCLFFANDIPDVVRQCVENFWLNSVSAQVEHSLLDPGEHRHDVGVGSVQGLKEARLSIVNTLWILVPYLLLLEKFEFFVAILENLNLFCSYLHILIPSSTCICA